MKIYLVHEKHYNQREDLIDSEVVGAFFSEAEAEKMQKEYEASQEENDYGDFFEYPIEPVNVI